MFDPNTCKPKLLIAVAMIAASMIANSASAQEFDAKSLLERMSDEIASLDSFIINGDGYSDARLAAGQIIEHSSQVTLRLRRPGSVRITNRDSEHTREVFFDNGLITVYNTERNMYAQTEIPIGVVSALDFAVNEVGIEVPLLDFISKDVAGHLSSDADEMSYLGTSLIRGEIFHHIGMRLPEVDVQIWIASTGRPLPGKVSISSKWEGGSPRFVAFLDWDTDPNIPGDSFNFDPPEGAIEIDFLMDAQR
jgi:hypothetical protein